MPQPPLQQLPQPKPILAITGGGRRFTPPWLMIWGTDFALTLVTQPSPTALLGGAAALHTYWGGMLVVAGAAIIWTGAGTAPGAAAVLGGLHLMGIGGGLAYATGVSYEEVDGGNIPGFRD